MYWIISSVEETLEMLGIVLFIRALTTHYLLRKETLNFEIFLTVTKTSGVQQVENRGLDGKVVGRNKVLR
jgi:hypothetical protein